MKERGMIFNSEMVRAILDGRKRGHPLNGENLHVTPLGARQCRECMRMHARNAKARKRDARNRN